MKECRTCKVSKPETEFYTRTVGQKSYLNPDCKRCAIAKAMEQSLARKAVVYARLGGKCYCCGETELTFLGIDHKDDDGAKHRRELNNPGGKLYNWLHGRPEEDHRFQLACHNCNMSKHILGVCAHQLDPDLVEAR